MNPVLLIASLSITGIVAFGAGAWFMSIIRKGQVQLARQQGLSEGAIERAQLVERLRHLSLMEKSLQDSETLIEQYRHQENLWHTEQGHFRAEQTALQQQTQALQEYLAVIQQTLHTQQAELSQKTALIAELHTRLDNEQRQSEEKLALLMVARQELSLQFKTLASDILEEKSRQFKEQHETGLGQLLNPLREKLTDFGNKVESIHRHDTEQQAQLRAELGQLKMLNQQMTDEAHHLATALKGQAKVQGNWGELVLENLLERTGLREGQDYRREVSFDTEEGRRRPDVIVYLPQSKHLVIDAKVSLNAYTRYINAEEENERRMALKEHSEAVGARIRELSDRSYFTLPGLNTPEMVFLFIPVESAFVEALRADDSLFQQALDRNVLVATPTTLMTSLNIVRQLWRFEEQNAHTAQLAESAARFYKKLVTFIGSMEQIGKDLERVRNTYDKAYLQFYTGKGNLIHQAHQFERLGVAIQQQLPEDLLSKAELELPDPSI